MTAPSQRTAQEVFADHLREGQEGSVEADLERNYAQDVVVFTSHGIYRGHQGIRELAERLRQELPEAMFHYLTQLVEGEIAFLEWTGQSLERQVKDGADSFLIRDGRIQAQTIHYTVEPNRS